MSAIESLLVDSDDDDLGDLDLSAITLEDILREEELATATANGVAAAGSVEGNTPDDDLFFSPATFTLSIAPVPGMEVVKGTGATANGAAANKKLDRAKSLTEMNAGGNAALVTGAANAAGAQFRSPLEIAEAREKQLLSCVGVELISPLQVKRRLRANARTKNVNSKKKDGSSKQKAKKKIIAVTSADGSAADKKQGKSTGVVKVQAMDAISRQLRKNIEFKEFGPGSPTVVAIHSKFIAIGTSKGLVIIFDHFQNVRIHYVRAWLKDRSSNRTLCVSSFSLSAFRFAKCWATQATPRPTDRSLRLTCRQAATTSCAASRAAASCCGI